MTKHSSKTKQLTKKQRRKEARRLLKGCFNKETYTFSEGMRLRALSLFVKDLDFLKNYRRVVDPQFFDLASERVVAEGIMTLYDENFCAPSRVLLKDHLGFHLPKKDAKGKPDPALAITAGPEVAALVKSIYRLDISQDLETVRKKVLHFGKRSAMKVALRQAAQFAKMFEDDKAAQVMAEAAAIDRPEGEKGAFHDETIEARISWRKRVKEMRIPTGMGPIDEILGGGLAPGWVVVLLGGTNVGKTTGCVNFMHGAATAGFNVLGVSTELARMWMDDKLDARITGIPSNEMLEREKALRKKLRIYYEKHRGRYHTHYYEPGSATVRDIRNYYQELKRGGFRPDVVVIDTPDLLKAALRYNKPHERLEEIYMSLFAWAGSEQVPIVVTSDIKQDRLNKRLIGREDAGGSYEKIKKADVVIGLGQDKKLREKDEIEEISQIWANFDKVRMGAAGKVVLIKVKGAYSKWHAERILEPREVREGSSIE